MVIRINNKPVSYVLDDTVFGQGPDKFFLEGLTVFRNLWLASFIFQVYEL